MIIVLILQIFIGIGLLRSINYETTLLKFLSLSLIVGITIISMVPFLLELSTIAITSRNIIILSVAIAVLSNLLPLFRLVRHKQKYLSLKIEQFQFYEIPGIGLTAYLLYISFWRSYNIPTYVRDVLSGPEPIADMAIKEQTLINSIFNLDLLSTNNQYKSPFLADLQIIYKMAGFDFGGLWIGLFAVAFTIFLYCILKEYVHGLLASLAIVLLTAAPEMYAYTFMYLFDYPNMVLWVAGVYFLYQLLQSPNKIHLLLVALSFALATYIRAETLILVVIMLGVYLILSYIKKQKIKNIIIYCAVITLSSFIAYYIPTQLYNNYYLPQDYAINTLINDNLADISPFFDRLSLITNDLLLGNTSKSLWLFNIRIFLVLFTIEVVYIIITKKYKSLSWYYWFGAVLVIYLGLPFMGYLMPLMNVEHSTKRSLFKLLPLLYLFIANFEFIKVLSNKLTKWETTSFNLSISSHEPQPIVAIAPKAPKTKSNTNKRKK